MLPKREDFGRLLADLFELPEEIILQLPLIFLLGNRYLYIENHRGIIEYNGSRIRLRLHRGQMVIEGDGFIIAELREKEIIVEGNIKDFMFEWGGEE